MNQAPFAERLSAAIREKRTPVMVGIDPSWDQLPPMIQDEAIARHGKTLKAVAEAYRQFSSAILDAVADLVPVVKFQAAFFEAIGPAGLIVLFDLMLKAKEAGLTVVFDGKRNDIGNTAAAYAQGYLGEFAIEGESHAVWSADAITVNPYLGARGDRTVLENRKPTWDRPLRPGSNEQSRGGVASGPGFRQ
ncbi:MAG: orotidine-5'-phosphate decarboxylase [Planctomycetota bacterium]